MKYEVKNAFYLCGELVTPGSVVELDEKEVAYFQPKEVLGDPVKPAKPKGKEGDPPPGGDV
jgi:hypothetical protein